MTYSDIKSKLRLHIGREQTLINQGFEIIAEVVGRAFGGKKESNENTNSPGTAAEMIAASKAMFR